MSHSNSTIAVKPPVAQVSTKPSLKLGAQVINESVMRWPHCSMKLNSDAAKILIAI